jgi:hypothetical protein
MTTLSTLACPNFKNWQKKVLKCLGIKAKILYTTTCPEEHQINTFMQYIRAYFMLSKTYMYI